MIKWRGGERGERKGYKKENCQIFFSTILKYRKKKKNKGEKGGMWVSFFFFFDKMKISEKEKKKILK